MNWLSGWSCARLLDCSIARLLACSLARPLPSLTTANGSITRDLFRSRNFRAARSSASVIHEIWNAPRRLYFSLVGVNPRFRAQFGLFQLVSNRTVSSLLPFLSLLSSFCTPLYEERAVVEKASLVELTLFSSSSSSFFCTFSTRT